MISCAQKYLSLNDRGKITVRTSNSIDRNLINDTDRGFVEWMDDQLQSNFFLFAPQVLKNERSEKNGSLTVNAVNMSMFKKNVNNADYYITKSKQDVLELIHKVCNNNKITQTTLTKWIKKWSQVRDVEVDLSYKRGNETGRFYRFISWPDQNNSFQDESEESEETPF
jgi:hypothetical protein